MPVNEALMAVMRATRSEAKELQKENEAKIEKDFVVNNWQFFAEDKGTVKSALFNHPKNGTELLQTLGINNVVIHKVKKDVLLKSLIDTEKSEIFKQFLDDVKVYQEVTTFFVVNKTALAMSNIVPLTVPGTFIHKFPSQGKLNDIYWQWSHNLLGKVRFY